MPQICSGNTIKLDEILCKDIIQKAVYFGFSERFDNVCLSESIETFPDGYKYFCQSKINASCKLTLPQDVLVLLDVRISHFVLTYKDTECPNCIFIRRMGTG